MRIGLEQMLKELKRLNPGKKFYVEKDYAIQSNKVIYGNCSSKKLVIPEGYWWEENQNDEDGELFISTRDEKGLKEVFLYSDFNRLSMNEKRSLVRA